MKGHDRLRRGRDAGIRRWIKFASAEFETTKAICFDLLLDKINNWKS
jgi:hypothetical protein